MASSLGRAQRECIKGRSSFLEDDASFWAEEVPKAESKHTRRYLHRKVACQVPNCTNSVESKAYFKVCSFEEAL